MHDAVLQDDGHCTQALDELQRRIGVAMAGDRTRLASKLRSLRSLAQAGKPFDRSLGRLERELAESIQRREQRAAHVPAVRFDSDLPIRHKRDEIAAAIQAHPVLIVCGETGSGKSTQLPKICLALGRGVDGAIGHTQPRRIAARSVAARVAEELAVPLGQEVGYKLRFQDRTSQETYVKLMTDGILLAETQSERQLRQYDTIIIDEAHERSLNIDFLLGYLKQLVQRRHDLRVVVTSATIDAERFADFYKTAEGPAPVIEVSGRTYPVDVCYRPVGATTDDDLERHIVKTVCEAAGQGPGDILVFLPTERDIRDVAKLLRSDAAARRVLGKSEILPLYARLSTADQDRVFKPSQSRRIVLATNVAESSLTVSGIRYVVDSGLARISRYAPRSKLQRLPVEPISRASADQRAGRCGRVGPGICYRLFSEADYESREPYTPPEIRRMNLASVVLRTLALGQADLEAFPFLDRPRPDAVRAGYKDLFELGAIDAERQLTPVGRKLSQLPVDPRIGRMILAAAEHGCLADVLIIAAALEVQDPRERPADRQKDADAAHARWAHAESDFLAILNLWNDFHELKATLSRRQLKKACGERYLSYARTREWQDVHRQLLDMAHQYGLANSGSRMQGTGNPTPRSGTTQRSGTHQSSADRKSGDFRYGRSSARSQAYAAIHKALLTGLLSGVAVYRPAKRDYLGAENQSFQLWPGAGLYRRRPKWVMAAELVETSQRYLRTVARIEPEWIEPLAAHLVERTHHFPRWSRKADTVLAQERASLYGLTVARRDVKYGPIAPVAARELFIREALVHGQTRAQLRLLRRNLQVLTQISSAAARTRSRKLIVDEGTLVAFYEERLPADVYDVTTLRRAMHRDGELAERLSMRWDDLVSETHINHFQEHFPDRLDLSDQRVPVDYRFEAGAKNDGVTVTVPEEILSELHEDQLGWLVPGLLEEKLVALIRTLPKELRRNLVPAPDAAREAASRMTFGQGRFLPTVAHALSEVAGEPIAPEVFQPDQLPAHLHANVRVVDKAGECIAEGRDLSQLRATILPESLPHGEPIHDPDWHRDGLQGWNFGGLPEQIEIRRGAYSWMAYPYLLDRGDSVALRLATTPSLTETRRAVRRLFILRHNSDLAHQIDWLPGYDELKNLAKPLCRRKRFRDQLKELIAARALNLESSLPRSAGQFEQTAACAVSRVPAAVQDIISVLRPLLEAYQDASTEYRRSRPVLPEPSAADLDRQLARLLQDDFLVETPWQWLQHVPRYLRGVALRIEKIRSGHADRDLRALEELQPHLNRLEAYNDRMGEAAVTDDQAVQYRWMLEEFRVSLFAQELGTSLKVSSARLDRQWGQVSE